MYYKNLKQNEREYEIASKKYEITIIVANEVNKVIDEKVAEVEAFIATNPQVGEDTTVLENLKKEFEELKALKVETVAKSEKVKELKESIEKMEEQINKLDEELLKVILSDLEAIGSEETEKKVIVSENSKLSTKILNINTLIENVNKAVKVEAERKAEEERKAKAEAEKKAREEALANVTKGDFTYFAGTYTEVGTSSKLTLDKSGKVTIDGRVFTNKPISIKKQSNGSYWCLVRQSELTDDGFAIYPVGVAGGAGNSQKVRIEVSEDMGASVYQKN